MSRIRHSMLTTVDKKNDRDTKLCDVCQNKKIFLQRELLCPSAEQIWGCPGGVKGGSERSQGWGADWRDSTHFGVTLVSWARLLGFAIGILLGAQPLGPLRWWGAVPPRPA